MDVGELTRTLRRAAADGDMPGEAAACAAIADAHTHNGDHADGARYAQHAWQIAAALDAGSPEAADAAGRLAAALCRVGATQTAARALKDALRRAVRAAPSAAVAWRTAQAQCAIHSALGRLRLHQRHVVLSGGRRGAFDARVMPCTESVQRAVAFGPRAEVLLGEARASFLAAHAAAASVETALSEGIVSAARAEAMLHPMRAMCRLNDALLVHASGTPDALSRLESLLATVFPESSASVVPESSASIIPESSASRISESSAEEADCEVGVVFDTDGCFAEDAYTAAKMHVLLCAAEAALCAPRTAQANFNGSEAAVRFLDRRLALAEQSGSSALRASALLALARAYMHGAHDVALAERALYLAKSLVDTRDVDECLADAVSHDLQAVLSARSLCARAHGAGSDAERGALLCRAGRLSEGLALVDASPASDHLSRHSVCGARAAALLGEHAQCARLSSFAMQHLATRADKGGGAVREMAFLYASSMAVLGSANSSELRRVLAPFVPGGACEGINVPGGACQMNVPGGACQMNVLGGARQMNVPGGEFQMNVPGGECQMNVLGAAVLVLSVRVGGCEGASANGALTALAEADLERASSAPLVAELATLDYFATRKASRGAMRLVDGPFQMAARTAGRKRGAVLVKAPRSSAECADVAPGARRERPGPSGKRTRPPGEHAPAIDLTAYDFASADTAVGGGAYDDDHCDFGQTDHTHPRSQPTRPAAGQGQLVTGMLAAAPMRVFVAVDGETHVLTVVDRASATLGDLRAMAVSQAVRADDAWPALALHPVIRGLRLDGALLADADAVSAALCDGARLSADVSAWVLATDTSGGAAMYADAVAALGLPAESVRVTAEAVAAEFLAARHVPALLALVRRLPAACVRSLSLRSMRGVSLGALCSSLPAGARVESLDLSFTDVLSHDCSVPGALSAALHGLRSLSLAHASGTLIVPVLRAIVPPAGEHDALERLDLSGLGHAPDVPTALASVLALSLPRLRTLALRHCRVDGPVREGLALLAARHGALGEVDVSACEWPDVDAPRVCCAPRTMRVLAARPQGTVSRVFGEGVCLITAP